MKIEDIVQLLEKRLNTFSLSKDYALMNGDLERVNEMDIEINGIKDTLFKLNLITEATRAVLGTDTNISSMVASSATGIINGYDISLYATDPLHEQKIINILKNMGDMASASDIDTYIQIKSTNSPLTGEMILGASKKYSVDVRLMMALMEQDSRFGTVGVAVKTFNPGNIGNNDAGETKTFSSWEQGVSAVAKWLNLHRVVLSPIEIPSVDTTAPSIVLNGETAVSIDRDETYTELGATAKDTDGTSVPVHISGTVDSSITGIYTLRYNATDSMGNKASEVIRTVTIRTPKIIPEPNTDTSSDEVVSSPSPTTESVIPPLQPVDPIIPPSISTTPSTSSSSVPQKETKSEPTSDSTDKENPPSTTDTAPENLSTIKEDILAYAKTKIAKSLGIRA